MTGGSNGGPAIRPSEGALFFDVVFFAEPLDAAGGVHQLLFTGKKRMTGGTNFNLDILDGGTGLYHITAGAGNFSKLIFGMNFFLHLS
jgi:hypothetical protein